MSSRDTSKIYNHLRKVKRYYGRANLKRIDHVANMMHEFPRAEFRTILQLRVPVLSVVLHHEHLWSGSIRIARCDQAVVPTVWRTSIFKGFKNFVV
jgi:hypothetical protein